jgi:hypothetical protein
MVEEVAENPSHYATTATMKGGLATTKNDFKQTTEVFSKYLEATVSDQLAIPEQSLSIAKDSIVPVNVVANPKATTMTPTHSPSVNLVPTPSNLPIHPHPPSHSHSEALHPLIYPSGTLIQKVVSMITKKTSTFHHLQSLELTYKSNSDTIKMQINQLCILVLDFVDTPSSELINTEKYTDIEFRVQMVESRMAKLCYACTLVE